MTGEGAGDAVVRVASHDVLRDRLGIPPDAQRVLVVGESTHWDPNWLLTSEGYWRWRVQRTLDRALDALEADERRVFGIECVFFLRMYWERRPDRRDLIRELVNTRRIQLTGSGVTTPDTLLPRTEAILRDFLVGQEWLRANGMTQEPRLAYFPDSFGHSPALPSLLRALGCDRAAVTRVDGMFFPGADWELPQRFPRPGSSAQILAQARAADFVWRDGSGSEVLCHWNSHGYGMGELLAHRGITRVNGLPFAVPDRREAHVARRIDAYASKLERVSPTPYLFCPVGYDFSTPLRGLVDLLDRYNRTRFGDTGTWAVCAGLDDHLSLVERHRGSLPVLTLDPNPYWTGFYTSRPGLKRSCQELFDDLLLAERLGVAVDDAGVRADLAQAWYTACTTNHHDFVTGTSPDRVVVREQRPWLDAASAAANKVLARLALDVQRPEPDPAPEPPGWHRGPDGTVTVETAAATFTVDPANGGTVTAHDRGGGQLLAPGSLDVAVWADSGGLWRMGHEFAGGRLEETAQAARRGSVDCDVVQADGAVTVTTCHDGGGVALRRTLIFDNGLAGVVCRSEATVGERRTVTVRFRVPAVESLLMDCPGGEVQRPLQRHYEPTFWPLQRWVRLGAVTVATEMPGAIAAGPDGSVDVVVGRNATHERAWGFLPIPGMPAPGHEPGVQVCEFAILAGGPPQRWPWPRDASRAALWRAAAAVVSCDRDDVEVAAVKAADRGEGIVVRLLAPAALGRSVRLRLTGTGLSKAVLCDARERDLDAVSIHDGAAVVPLEQAITSVRLIPDRP